MKIRTTEQYKEMIEKHWRCNSVTFYLAQILSGESTVEETREDLESFEEKNKP